MTIWDMIGEGSGYTVKSLFSGAGGLDWGLSQAGLDVVESYEFEKHPCDTLAGLGESDVYKCDISRLLLEGQVCTNIVTATFPCTYFSSAGLRNGDASTSKPSGSYSAFLPRRSSSRMSRA